MWRLLSKFIDKSRCLLCCSSPPHITTSVIDKLSLITELCTGGDLTTRKLDELQSTIITEQILQALAYMHRRDIRHCDIKLENVLYKNGGKDSTIRLIDFGLSNKFDQSKKKCRTTSTAYTLSPEMAKGSGLYTEKTDMWSVGVVAWILLAGDAPFLRTDNDLKKKENLDRLLNADYTFGVTWKGRSISQHAKIFVGKCLQRHPEDRWTSKEALRYIQDTWLPALEERHNEERDAPALEPLFPVVKDHKHHMLAAGMESAGINIEEVAGFCSYGSMKKMIFIIMANTMEREELSGLNNIFLGMDTNNTGTVSLLELKAAFAELRPEMSETDVETLFRSIDQDGCGQIYWVEFLAAMSECCGLVTLDRLAEAFDRIDTEGKGYISHGDLKSLLGKDYDTNTVDRMIKEADFKNNGQVDYEELQQLMFKDSETG